MNDWNKLGGGQSYRSDQGGKSGLKVNGIGGPRPYSISQLQLDDVKNKLRSEVISILCERRLDSDSRDGRQGSGEWENNCDWRCS